MQDNYSQNINNYTVTVMTDIPDVVTNYYKSMVSHV